MNNLISFLKVKGCQIVDENAKAVYLRGVNLGGWLMMEGYILQGRNFAEHLFKQKFAKINGPGELNNFTRLYRRNFITYQDIQRIKQLGANCLRLPFNYRLIQKEQAWNYLDNVIKWCKKAKIWCILDLHAAAGAQNPDWHSDSQGQALLWQEQKWQNKYVWLWRKIAARYQNEAAIAGYDVLNEPAAINPWQVNQLYARVVKEIRKVDQNHIIFLEANLWGQQLRALGKPKDKNTVPSIHIYQPLNFTFNFQPHLKYPGYIDGQYWDSKQVFRMVMQYHQLAKKWQVPIYVGEFGVNFRSPQYYGELRYLKDVLECFKKFNFHWTYWTYKAAAGGIYPDGVYQYLPNTPWIKREGPISGWENFYYLWKKYKMSIIASWKTENFTENQYLSRLLKQYFK